MDWLNWITDIALSLPGNVLGEVAGDLVELGAKWIKDRHKQNKFVRRVGEALERFLRVPGGEDFLGEVAKNAPPPPKKRLIARGEKDLGRELAEHAMENVDGFNIETWSARLLQNVDTARFGKDVQKEFLILLGEIRGAAAEYWKSFLERKDFAIVNLIAQTVDARTAGLQETIRHEIQSYLFVSGPDVQPPKVQILQCTSCGKDFSPSRLQRTESGLFTCNCPDCGTALTMGSFTEEGRSWAKECDEKLDTVLTQLAGLSSRMDDVLEEIGQQRELRESRIAECRKRLDEELGAKYINGSRVREAAEELCDLCPDDPAAQFYYFVESNRSSPFRIGEYLTKLDVVSFGKERLNTALDYLINRREPHIELALIRLVDRAVESRLFSKQEQEQAVKRIHSASSRGYDPLARYDLFLAYSGKDVDEVTRLANALEERGMSCFVSFRDLPRYSEEGPTNYWKWLTSAMDRSAGIVFVSTRHSRRRDCDAIQRADGDKEGELAYFLRKYPQRPRIVYVPSSDREETMDKGLRDFLRKFAGDEQYRRSITAVCNKAAELVDPLSRQTENVAPMSEVEAEKRKKAEEEAAKRKAAEEARQRKEAAEKQKYKAKAEQRFKAEGIEILPESELRIEDGVLIGLVNEEKIKNPDKKYAIIIPEGVERIGEFAFQDCCSLTSIIIPESVKSIEWFAFGKCSSLTSIALPESVTSIEESVFEYCKSLTSITIPKSVTSIGACAFIACNSLTSITIPEGVTSIGASTFWNCRSLKNITIPEGVTTIGENAFEYCSSLTSITIPKSVTSIGENAFYGCAAIEKIEIARGNRHYHVVDGRLIEKANGEIVAEVCETVRRASEEAKRRAEAEKKRKQAARKRRSREFHENAGAFFGKVAKGAKVAALGVFCALFVAAVVAILVLEAIGAAGMSAAALQMQKIGFYVSIGALVLCIIVFIVLIRRYRSRFFHWIEGLCIVLAIGLVVMGGITLSMDRLAIASLEEDEENGVVYAREGNSYTVFQIESAREDVLIRSEYDGLLVTGVRDGAVRGNTAMKTLTFAPNGTYRLGNSAFANCTALTEVSFGDSSGFSIWKQVFSDCPRLTEVDCGSGCTLTFDDWNAFELCPKLKEFRVNDSKLVINTTLDINCDKLLFGGVTEAVIYVDGGNTSYFADNVGGFVVGKGSAVGLAHYVNNYDSIGDVHVGSYRFEKGFDFPDSTFATVKLSNYVFVQETEYQALADKIYLPSSVTYIPDNFFGDIGDGCTVYYEGSAEDWAALTIGANGNSNYANGKVTMRYDCDLEDGSGED